MNWQYDGHESRTFFQRNIGLRRNLLPGDRLVSGNSNMSDHGEAARSEALARQVMPYANAPRKKSVREHAAQRDPDCEQDLPLESAKPRWDLLEST